jgi:hypothetical protein
MSEAQKGKVYTQVSLDKMSKAKKGKKPNNSKKVVDTFTGQIYSDCEAAANAIGMKSGRLYTYLTGRNKNPTNLKYYE